MFTPKKLAVAVAAAACTFPMFAVAGEVTSRSDMQIYGRAHLSVDSLNDGDNYNEINISSNSSRLGFRGKTDFESVTAFFQIEQQIDFDTDGTQFATRDTFAGVRGDFGSVRIGKFDTPFKAARGPANLFGDQVGDMRNLTRVGNARFDERFANVVHYQTPKFGAMQLNVAYSHHEGNANTSDKKDSAFSTSLVYKEGPIDFAIAYEAFAKEASRGQRNAIRAALGYKAMDNLNLVAFYQTADHKTDDNLDSRVYGLGADYAITPRKTYLRGHYFMRDAKADNRDSSLFTVGLEHRVDSALRFYANAAQVSNDSAVALTPWSQARTATPAGANGKTARGISIGMRYDF